MRRIRSKLSEAVYQKMADTGSRKVPIVGSRERRSIADIIIKDRTRKDLGDLAALAQSIREVGLLQPIGVSKDNELVFGQRRLRACADILGWKYIDVRVIALPLGSARAEHDENELRKAFTPSERVAILETMQRKHKGQGNLPDLPNIATASKQAGFDSRQTADNARRVVKKGVAELVEAMDKGAISIDAAAKVATLEPDDQGQILRMPPVERHQEIARLRKGGTRRLRKLTIPNSAAQAARIIVQRWGPSLIRELIAALEKKLQEAA